MLRLSPRMIRTTLQPASVLPVGQCEVVHPNRIGVRVTVAVELEMHSEVAAGATDGLRIESHVNWIDLAIDADRDEMRVSADAFVFHAQLDMGEGKWPSTGYSRWHPMLIRGVPHLPDAIAKRALG